MRASCCPRLQQVAKSTGAVSRYKVECEPEFVPVADVYSGQRRESGFITEPVVVQRAENQAKTVTSLLILLSVLQVVVV